MNFHQFGTTLEPYLVFSRADIGAYFQSFDFKNLVNWQDAQYIQKVRNGWYRFTRRPLNEAELYFCANRIYSPSYIS